MSAGAAAIAANNVASNVLPSTARLRLPYKREYFLPLLRAKPKGSAPVRKTPLLRTRVKSNPLPRRYAKSTQQGFLRIDENLRKKKNIDLGKAREVSKKMKLEEMKQKGMMNTVDERERQRSDILNTFRFGTKSYKRYKSHHKKVQNLQDINEIRASNFKFFLEEAKKEVKSPNNDELSDEELQNAKEPESEEEFMHMMEKTMYKNLGLYPMEVRYKALNALLEILADLEQDGQLLRISTTDLNELFELALPFNEDTELRMKTIFISGNLLHRITNFKGMRLDRIASYIVACITSQQFGDALQLLTQFDNEKAIWYKLKTLLWIGVGNMYEAEKVVMEMKRQFKVRFIHGDIYVALMNRYHFGQNFERLEYWRKEFEQMIEQRGFNKDNRLISKYFEAPEEEKLDYMGQFGQIGYVQYLRILSLYISTKELNDKVPGMIEFYIAQPLAKSQDLQELLLSFKYELSSKIRPQLQNMTKKSAERELLKFVDDYQQENPEIVEQEEFLNSFLNDLAMTGGFQSITFIIENLIKNKQAPSEEHYTALIKALMRRKEIDLAFKVLAALEQSHYALIGQDPSMIMEERLIHPVTPKHYTQFLRYFADRNNFEEFNKILERIADAGYQNHPVVLRSILKSYFANDKFKESYEYIERILLNDVHLQTSRMETSFLGIYSIIWQIIRETLIRSKDPLVIKEVNSIPDIRFLFMKMVHDNTVPTSKLYNTILDVFLRSHDFYGAICVIQYFGKIHRIMPHQSTRRKIKKICTIIKYDKNFSKMIPDIDYKKRYNMVEANDKYYEAFLKIKQEQPDYSSANSMDPFAPKDPIKESQETRLQEHGEDEIDRAWKYLVTQMMRVITAQSTFNREVLIQTHEDFGLSYEADKVVKDHDEWLKIPRRSTWETFVQNTKTLKEMDPLPEIDLGDLKKE